MKSVLFLISFCVAVLNSFGQTFKVRIDNDKEEFVSDQKEITASKAVQRFEIKTVNATGLDYTVTMGGASLGTFRGDAQYHLIAGIKDGQVIQIIKNGDTQPLETFGLKIDDGKNIVGNDSGRAKIVIPSMSILDFISSKYSLKSTRLGLVAQKSGALKNNGNEFTHIFLDQYGNNIFSTIPQGVPERQYVVHVIYLAPVGTRNLIYSVNESKSGFNPALSIYNADIRKILGNFGVTSTISTEAKEKNVVVYEWIDQEILLSTSTEDIEFELFRVIVDNDSLHLFDKTKLATFNIKMTPRYHVSMDVGLVKTELANPNYQHIESPVNANEKVVKESDGGSRGVVTVMATFYTSPIILLKKYVLKKNIPAYKLSGRNFLDDHTLFERIYPTIGVGFTDKTLENLFAGLNWEIVRGGAIFAGWHYGRVNVFDVSNGFQYGVTPISDSEFSYRKDVKWRTGFSVGVKVDARVILSLFGSQSGDQ